MLVAGRRLRFECWPARCPGPVHEHWQPPPPNCGHRPWVACSSDCLVLLRRRSAKHKHKHTEWGRWAFGEEFSGLPHPFLVGSRIHDIQLYANSVPMMPYSANVAAATSIISGVSQAAVTGKKPLHTVTPDRLTDAVCHVDRCIRSLQRHQDACGACQQALCWKCCRCQLAHVQRDRAAECCTQHDPLWLTARDERCSASAAGRGRYAHSRELKCGSIGHATHSCTAS
jgi:hypothetical protein